MRHDHANIGFAGVEMRRIGLQAKPFPHAVQVQAVGLPHLDRLLSGRPRPSPDPSRTLCSLSDLLKTQARPDEDPSSTWWFIESPSATWSQHMSDLTQMCPQHCSAFHDQLWLFHRWGPFQKEKGTDPSRGTVILKHLCGRIILCLPGLKDLQACATQKFRICFEVVFRMFQGIAPAWAPAMQQLCWFVFLHHVLEEGRKYLS